MEGATVDANTLPRLHILQKAKMQSDFVRYLYRQLQKQTQAVLLHAQDMQGCSQ